MKRISRYFRHITTATIENDFFGMAAEMGFWLMLGIFPAMLFLMSIFGWMGNKSYINPVLLFLSNVIPADSMKLIHTVLNEVMLFSKGTLVATIGIIVTLFLTTNAIACVLKGLNRAYKVEETRSFVYTRVLSLIMVFVNTFMLFLSINLIIFGKTIIHLLVTYAGMSHSLSVTILTLRWPVAFLALYLMALINYYILPDFKGVEKIKRKSTFLGTLFFCVFWLVGSWVFSIYVNNMQTYNRVYGTIGAFAMLMVWLYYTSLLLLIGGEINSQVYEKLDDSND